MVAQKAERMAGVNSLGFGPVEDGRKLIEKFSGRCVKIRPGELGR